jgi:hypothetical protein
MRRADDGALLRVDRAVARRFEPHVVVLRSLAEARVAVDPGAVVAMDDSCTSTPERLELAGGSWKARGPAAFDVDAVAVTDLLSALSRARADAWGAESDDGTFGFGAPGACAVRLTLASDADGAAARQVGLVFGASADADARDVGAHAIGDPRVFLAPRVLREIAAHPAVDRGRFRIDPVNLSRVVLARGGAKLVLARPSGAGRLVRVGVASGDAEDDKLETALAGLYAQSALHVGPPSPAEGFDNPILEIELVPAPDSRASSGTRLTFGAPVHESAVDGYFARASGVEATFLVARHLVDAILEAW